MAETDPRKVSSEDDVSETRPPGTDGSAAEGSAPLTDGSAGQVILDDYVVERELGQGGMGKVYLLRSRSTGQPFAVKRAVAPQRRPPKRLPRRIPDLDRLAGASPSGRLLLLPDGGR